MFCQERNQEATKHFPQKLKRIGPPNLSKESAQGDLEYFGIELSLHLETIVSNY